MAIFVVDASAIVPRYVQEVATPWTMRFLDEAGTAPHELHAPDLVYLEVANALWKHVRPGRMQAEAAAAHLDHLMGSPFYVHETATLTYDALRLANDTGASVYDATYLVLARRTGGTLATLDRRLVERADAAGVPTATLD